MLNLVVVIGTLAKPVQARNLPSGYTLASFDLSVARPDQPADIVPVALFDAPQQVSQWQTGQALLVLGRIRRRYFRVGGSTQSRTEVVADQVVPINEMDGVSSAIADAGLTLAGVLEDLPAWERPL